MLKGFKEFIMKGNLVDLAVAFIMATAFAAVVTALVELIMAFIALITGGQGEVGQLNIGSEEHYVNVGPFLTALISFVMLSAVVYFFIVVPYKKIEERAKRGKVEEEVTPDDILLLQEIRDLLKGSEGETPGTRSSKVL